MEKGATPDGVLSVVRAEQTGGRFVIVEVDVGVGLETGVVEEDIASQAGLVVDKTLVSGSAMVAVTVVWLPKIIWIGVSVVDNALKVMVAIFVGVLIDLVISVPVDMTIMALPAVYVGPSSIEGRAFVGERPASAVASFEES